MSRHFSECVATTGRNPRVPGTSPFIFTTTQKSWATSFVNWESKSLKSLQTSPTAQEKQKQTKNKNQKQTLVLTFREGGTGHTAYMLACPNYLFTQDLQHTCQHALTSDSQSCVRLSFDLRCLRTKERVYSKLHSTSTLRPAGQEWIDSSWFIGWFGKCGWCCQSLTHMEFQEKQSSGNKNALFFNHSVCTSITRSFEILTFMLPARHSWLLLLRLPTYPHLVT